MEELALLDEAMREANVKLEMANSDVRNMFKSLNDFSTRKIVSNNKLKTSWQRRYYRNPGVLGQSITEAASFFSRSGCNAACNFDHLEGASLHCGMGSQVLR
jgi:hypothetical protein